MCHRKALVDIISMVKHAAREESPLLTSAERVALAFGRGTPRVEGIAGSRHSVRRRRFGVMRDLVVVVPAKDTEQALTGLRKRPESIRVRPIDFVIRVHPQKDPGGHRLPRMAFSSSRFLAIY